MKHIRASIQRMSDTGASLEHTDISTGTGIKAESRTARFGLIQVNGKSETDVVAGDHEVMNHSGIGRPKTSDLRVPLASMT